LDARVLARFAAAIQPPARPLPTAEAVALADLLARRRQLVEMVTMEKTRLQQAQYASVREDIQAHLDWLHQRLNTTERGLREAVEASPAWQAKADLLTEVNGLGEVTQGETVLPLSDLVAEGLTLDPGQARSAALHCAPSWRGETGIELARHHPAAGRG
ncbi:MAG: hypothetical protein WBM15_13370, partial [Chromatiaceae bacterium]